MPKYFYITRDKLGNKLSGAEEAASQDDMLNRLQAKGLIVVNIISEENTKETDFPFEKGSGIKNKIHVKHERITSSDITLFCRQLSTLLGAGVTILRSLNIISQQVSSRRLQGIIKDLNKSMEAGLSFHEAIAKHPRVFSELWVNLIESGEASGNLAVVLSRLATYLEKTAAFRGKIVSALVYPAILLFAGLAALFFMTFKIIPTFVEVFKGFNLELPYLTQVLVDVSAFLRSWGAGIIVVIIIAFISFKKYIAGNKGAKKRYQEFLLKLPLFGDFFRTLSIERFTSEMSTLVESGVPILYSLEISERSVNNLILGEVIHNIKEAVCAGKPVGQSLNASNFFDPMVVQMVSIGEEIGELPDMFKKLNAFYQDYLDTFLTRFTAMFEPAMLIFMGLVIGIMVIGLFLPIFKIASMGSSM